jgi:hypothetical protein
VERVISFGGGKTSARYFGAMLRHDKFTPVRDGLLVKDRGKTARAEYDALRTVAPYESLPEWSTLAAAPDALSAWEAAHPDHCTRSRDDGQFFGFSSVAQGYLGRYTRLLYIPAVRDAADDAEEGRGSVLTSLMDLVVRTAVANRPALVRLKQRSQALYERALDPTAIPQLVDLGKNLTSTLQTLVPEVSIELQWRQLAELDLPLPSADVRVVEDGYPSAVERTGHGLQRAFIMTMLQHLAMAQAVEAEQERESPTAELPNLVLAIEEPELYQHPSRQRHFARTLDRLAEGTLKGVADRTQVLYGTHSPLFVAIDNIHRVRLLRRVGETPGLPKVTRVVRTSLGEVADELWRADGQPQPPYTAITLLPRLTTIMTPMMSEGYFANAVVLVEGEDDRAALLGTAQVLGFDLESVGIAIIPCGGKTCLDRPFVIFRRLGLPVYLLWDGDKGAKDAQAIDNHRLLRLIGAQVTDWPNSIEDGYSCFERDLETTMQAEIGDEDYEALLTKHQAAMGIRKRKHAQKNPSLVSAVLRDVHALGKSLPSLEAIAKKVWTLR